MTVRVPDKRLDELTKLAQDAETFMRDLDWQDRRHCHPLGSLGFIAGDAEAPHSPTGAFCDTVSPDVIAALVADLRAARADNQRLRERISEAIGAPARGLASDADDWRRPHPLGGSVNGALFTGLPPLDDEGVLWVAALDRVPIEERVEWMRTMLARVRDINESRAAQGSAE